MVPAEPYRSRTQSGGRLGAAATAEFDPKLTFGAVCRSVRDAHADLTRPPCWRLNADVCLNVAVARPSSRRSPTRMLRHGRSLQPPDPHRADPGAELSPWLSVTPVLRPRPGSTRLVRAAPASPHHHPLAATALSWSTNRAVRFASAWRPTGGGGARQPPATCSGCARPPHHVVDKPGHQGNVG